MKTINSFTAKDLRPKPIPNYWDAIAMVLILTLFSLVVWGGRQMTLAYTLESTPTITLAVSALPHYAFRSVLRLFIALFFAFLATFTLGTLAAKNRQCERFIIPLIDILQSLPVLGVLPMSVLVFITLFPGSLLGPECAAITAIFFSQAWNIILSFYQSLRSMPRELNDVGQVFQLSAWQRFWRIEVPFAMPGLLMNTMLSMSAAWFFVVASEVIYVGTQPIYLPGIGSYVAVALLQQNGAAIVYALITMFLVILCYDQLLFRPLNLWLEQFYSTQEDFQSRRSWVVTLFSRTNLLRFITQSVSQLIPRRSIPSLKRPSSPIQHRSSIMIALRWAVNPLLILAILSAGYTFIPRLILSYNLPEALMVCKLGAITALRIFILIILSVILWVPIGVWVGSHPKAARIVQPLIQFTAAFPANLLYPILVPAIVSLHLNINIWAAPLIVLGTQWYILFNVIAGAKAVPKELRYVGKSLQLSHFLWWRKIMLPAIFPTLVTGMITATGGAWNASIVAEALSWGSTHLYATGLGAYIAQASESHNFNHLILGVVVMAAFVLVINRLCWQPLYHYAEKRFKMDTL